MGRSRVADQDWPSCSARGCERPAAAKGYCTRHHKQLMRGTLGRADRVGEKSDLWHGQYGRLAVSEDGTAVQCHVCGQWLANLGSHLRLRHDMSAAEYREAFGLGGKFATPLAAPALRETLAASSTARVGNPEWARFAARRDATNRQTVQTATEATRAGLAPGAKDQRERQMLMSARRGRGRKVCAEDGCINLVSPAPSSNSRRNRCDEHERGRR